MARRSRGPGRGHLGGRIAAVGPKRDVERALESAGLPLPGSPGSTPRAGWSRPGLVDPHTHLLFAGSREGELALRQRGAGYLEILAAGGGILSTVAATRAASVDDLLAHGRRWLDEMLHHGVTTIEAKSGYGLDLRTELRLLEVAHQLGQEGPIDVLPTWLGAHAVPAEFRDRRDPTEAYTPYLLDEQLAGIAAQGRARFADVFCERGVFSPDQSRRILAAAEPMGCGRGSTPTSWRRRAGRSWRPRSAPCRPITWRSRRRPGSTPLPGGRVEPAGRGGPPPGHDLVPHEAAARPPANSSSAASRSRSGPISTRARRRRRACRWR